MEGIGGRRGESRAFVGCALKGGCVKCVSRGEHDSGTLGRCAYMCVHTARAKERERERGNVGLRVVSCALRDATERRRDSSSRRLPAVERRAREERTLPGRNARRRERGREREERTIGSIGRNRSQDARDSCGLPPRCAHYRRTLQKRVTRREKKSQRN